MTFCLCVLPVPLALSPTEGSSVEGSGAEGCVSAVAFLKQSLCALRASVANPLSGAFSLLFLCASAVAFLNQSLCALRAFVANLSPGVSHASHQA